jgi:hypothetical protein
MKLMGYKGKTMNLINPKKELFFNLCCVRNMSNSFAGLSDMLLSNRKRLPFNWREYPIT